MSAPRFVSIAQLSDILGVEHKTIRRLIARGELRAVRVGRVLRVDLDDALATLAYEPTSPKAYERQPRPRPITGEFSRRAREAASAPRRSRRAVLTR